MSTTLIAIGALSALGGFAGVASGFALTRTRAALRQAQNTLDSATGAHDTLMRAYVKMVVTSNEERRFKKRVQELLEANNRYLERARQGEYALHDVLAVNRSQEAALDYLVNALDIKREDVVEDHEVPDEIRAILVTTMERTGTWPAPVAVAA